MNNHLVLLLLLRLLLLLLLLFSSLSLPLSSLLLLSFFPRLKKLSTIINIVDLFIHFQPLRHRLRTGLVHFTCFKTPKEG